MIDGPFKYFIDPVLRAPTIGCMLMCFSAALVGVIALLRKQSLVGESLSHAAYPGVILGVLAASLCLGDAYTDASLALWILVFAFSAALLGIALIHWLQHYLKVSSDSALCFVLSAFFGIGITLASYVQFAHTTLYNQVQVYLYGQAATMMDIHVIIYGALALIITIFMVFLYKELQVMTFDRQYAESLGIKVKFIDAIVFILICLAVIIGIRSVGVVLMSAMLIAPPVAARQYTNKLSHMMALAAIFGLVSGFLGNYLSVEISNYLSATYPKARLILPTGPMIVVVATIICLFSLLFAPERGLVLRLWRIANFRYTRICENLLKTIWRLGEHKNVKFEEAAKYQSVSGMYLKFILGRLIHHGLVKKTPPDYYQLTDLGRQKALKIVRLHRLWEVYLADYLGVGAEKVHANAGEMEHIITPELELSLTELLNDPKNDPHNQPIPPRQP